MVVINSGNRNATTGWCPLGWTAAASQKGAGLAWAGQGITPAQVRPVSV